MGRAKIGLLVRGKRVGGGGESSDERLDGVLFLEASHFNLPFAFIASVSSLVTSEVRVRASSRASASSAALSSGLTRKVILASLGMWGAVLHRLALFHERTYIGRVRQLLPLLLMIAVPANADDWSAGPAPKDCPTWGTMNMVFLAPPMVSAACAPIVGPNKAGCYIPATNTAIVPDPSTVSAKEFQRVVGHELCHRNGGKHRDNTTLAAAKPLS